MMLNHKRLLGAVLVLFIGAVVFPGPLSADPPTVPPGHAMYIMVLRVPGDSASGDPKRKKPEPDVGKLGGSVRHKEGNRRVIVLPLAAVSKLREDPEVAYLQRVWMGEPLETWNEPDNGGKKSGELRPSADDLGPTWTTGDYEYDGSGNIKEMGTDTYSYDTASRLVKAVVSNTTETYKYDSFGNLVEKTTGASTRTIPTDPSSNRLSGETYDEQGSVLTQDRVPRYTYDALGMVTTIQPADPSFYKKRMIYTADDERIAIFWTGGGPSEKPSDSRWTIRDFDGKVLRHFFLDTGVVWKWMGDYIYSEGRLVGEERPSIYGGKLAMHLDHLGTVRMMTRADRMRYGRHDFYPFGTEQTSTVQELTNFFFTGIEKPEQMKFTGHQRDFYGTANVENTDYVDYMHARYYNPHQGRFLSVDPGGYFPERPQSWNRYAYASNNPINRVDPDGREDTWAQRAAAKMAAAGQAIKAAGASLNNGGAMGTIADATLGTVGDLVGGSGDMLNVGTATGEAIGSGADAHDMTMAISQDVGRGSALVLTMAAPSASAHRSMTTTRVFRAVDGTEAANIQSTGAFRPSPNGTEFKGFFFKRQDATSFAQRMTQQTGEAHTVVAGRAPNSVVRNSPAHNAATEGRGVLIRNTDLDKVVPK